MERLAVPGCSGRRVSSTVSVLLTGFGITNRDPTIEKGDFFG